VLPAILLVGGSSVEWLDDDARRGTLHGRSPVASLDATTLAEAALAALRASGAEPRACILALDRPLAGHGLIGVPELVRKELPAILERKAAKLVDGDARPLFVGLPMTLALAEPGKESRERTWLLTAIRGTLVRNLCLALRARGIPVGRIVSLSLSALERARAASSRPEEAAILVLVDRNGVSVSLVKDAELVNQDAIEGDLFENPSLATGLIHGIKSCAGFWRKHSRGKQVGEIIVLGLPGERALLLSHAIGTAVPGAHVTLLRAEGEATEVVQQDWLRSAHVAGALSPDFTFRLPPRHSRLAVLALVTLLASAGVGAWTWRSLTGELTEIQARTRTLLVGTDGLDPLSEQNQASAAQVERLHAYVERAARAAHIGLDHDRLLADVQSAFHRRAELLGLTVLGSSADGPPMVLIQGRADADPARVLVALRGLGEELERSTQLTQVAVRLPDRIPVAPERGGRAQIEFTVEALVESES
jgi:hypothetical protein